MEVGNRRTEQATKMARHGRDGLRQNQNGVQMEGPVQLQLNHWWRRGEEVLRRSRSKSTAMADSGRGLSHSFLNLNS